MRHMLLSTVGRSTNNVITLAILTVSKQARLIVLSVVNTTFLGSFSAVVGKEDN